MNHARAVLVAAAFCAIAFASSSAQDSKAIAPKAEEASAAQQATKGHEYSGMYSFLKDGEFVQITVEDEGRCTRCGSISRAQWNATAPARAGVRTMVRASAARN
jgi:hypothetical protein